jgi:glycosyltransferase involved in cell wall biosynthesis
VNLNLSEFDAVYSPCQPIDVSRYPNTKFIFGPHFSVFPNTNQMNTIKGKNSIYIQPSDWVVDLWKSFPYCNDINIKLFAFGVHTDKFNEINSINYRSKVFVYFKRRRPDEIDALLSFLKSKNIEIEIFDYEKKYSEEKYLNYLQNSKYGIWLDAHESQGFALEEALSCNVPLLVWNVSSMNQEYRSSYNNIPATTIPYWDARCGEYFYNVDELEETFNKFLSKIDTYKPREFILENLSMKICEQKLVDIIENI